jgi:lipopolysaccharide transport protein LptA
MKTTHVIYGVALSFLVTLIGASGQDKLANLVQKKSGRGETVITSDQIVFDYKRHVAEFKGSVVADDGEMVVKADKMVVSFGETNEIQAIKADGNVEITSEDKVGHANSAIYRSKDSSVQLLGNAQVTRGADSVSGQEIVIWINDDRMIVKKGSKLIMNTGSASGATR